MKKYTTLLLSTMLLLSVNIAFGADYSSNTSYDSTAKEYNFENNSYNISDEQLTREVDADILQEDKKVSFWQKVVNSSHFSSSTATKTWIPTKKDVQP